MSTGIGVAAEYLSEHWRKQSADCQLSMLSTLNDNSTHSPIQQCISIKPYDIWNQPSENTPEPPHRLLDRSSSHQP